MSRDPEPAPLVCVLNALSPADQQRRVLLMGRLMEGVTGIEEEPAALRFLLDGSPESWLAAAELVLLERRCCPFLTLELVAPAALAPGWLRAAGPAGTPEFLRHELGLD